VTEVWESKEAQGAFMGTRLGPAQRRRSNEDALACCAPDGTCRHRRAGVARDRERTGSRSVWLTRCRPPSRRYGRPWAAGGADLRGQREDRESGSNMVGPIRPTGHPQVTRAGERDGKGISTLFVTQGRGDCDNRGPSVAPSDVGGHRIGVRR
jgi:hypothetical protein